jgi:hypothetical protein
MPSLRDGWPGGRHASGTPIREARVARAAQHVPEVTLTMPAWKWKHATDRLGGIQEGTQTHKRTHQPHTRTGARTGTRTCISALLLPRLALLLGKLPALLRDQLDHPLHVEQGTARRVTTQYRMLQRSTTRRARAPRPALPRSTARGPPCCERGASASCTARTPRPRRRRCKPATLRRL